MTSLPARLYADLIGKPFVAGARGPEAYDCLGLAITLLRRQGFALPEYASTAQEAAAQLRDGLLGPCVQIQFPETGCVVWMRAPGSAANRHLGIMLDRFHMIHASEAAGSVVIETLTSSPWGRRVLGFYAPEVRS